MPKVRGTGCVAFADSAGSISWVEGVGLSWIADDWIDRGEYTSVGQRRVVRERPDGVGQRVSDCRTGQSSQCFGQTEESLPRAVEISTSIERRTSEKR